MGCFNSTPTPRPPSKETTGPKDRDPPPAPTAESTTSHTRRNYAPQPPKTAWEVLNDGPGKGDAAAHRRRDQRRLEALVRSAKLRQENPTADPNIPPTLSSRSVAGIAQYIKDDSTGPKRIVVLAGAGISTSAGIPDFRSPGTGLYANLARLNLPYPEAVFELKFFRKNPMPFYVLRKEMCSGKFFPTVSHAFIALLYENWLLKMLFTQKIDGLERRAGVPEQLIVEAHGSFATHRCIECEAEYPGDLMKEMVESGEVPRCRGAECNGLVKPDIVFFGENLPKRFFENVDVPREANLVLVMGTSLSVAPFASLPSYATRGTPRVLFNKDRVGDLGNRPDDVVVLGDCDAGVRKLASALEWGEELEKLWLKVSGDVEETMKEDAGEGNLGQAIPQGDSHNVESERLAKEAERSLNITEQHSEPDR